MLSLGWFPSDPILYHGKYLHVIGYWNGCYFSILHGLVVEKLADIGSFMPFIVFASLQMRISWEQSLQIRGNSLVKFRKWLPGRHYLFSIGKSPIFKVKFQLNSVLRCCKFQSYEDLCERLVTSPLNSCKMLWRSQVSIKVFLIVYLNRGEMTIIVHNHRCNYLGNNILTSSEHL